MHSIPLKVFGRGWGCRGKEKPFCRKRFSLPPANPNKIKNMD